MNILCGSFCLWEVKTFINLCIRKKVKEQKFTENPENPILELKDFKEKNRKFSLLLLPPSSPETVEFALDNFEEIIVVDYCSRRLALFNEKTSFKFNTKLIKDSCDFRNWISGFSSYINFGKVTSYMPNRYARLDYKLRCILKEDLLEVQKEMCSFAVNRSLKGWHRNLNTFENIKNLNSSVFQLPSINRADAVIVGAGPSLDDTVSKLKKYKDKYYIIATDGSLKTLLRNQLIPDIIVSCEDTVMSWQFFDGYFDLLKDTPLVVSHNSNTYLIKNYPGPVCLSKNSNVEDWCSEFINHLPIIETGRCVGHYAFNLALSINAGRIIMIGFDLAFKGGVFHPKDMAVPYFHDMPVPVPVTVQSIHGDLLKTDLSMLTYLKDFEYMIKNSPVDVVDATEGGAFKKGSLITSIDKIKFHKKKEELKWISEEFASGDELISKIKSDVHFKEKLKLSFTSYLVQKSDTSSSLEKQADIHNSEKFLNALLEEEQPKNSNKTILVSSLDIIDSDISEWAEMNSIEIYKSKNLSEIIIRIKKEGIKSIYCLNGDICPDLLHLCDIQCTDIKTNAEACNYERALWLENYSVITSSDNFGFWRDFIPEKVNVSEVSFGLHAEKVNDGY